MRRPPRSWRGSFSMLLKRSGIPLSGRWESSGHRAGRKPSSRPMMVRALSRPVCYVPRSVRVLAADPLVDDHFRQLWFGWARSGAGAHRVRAPARGHGVAAGGRCDHGPGECAARCRSGTSTVMHAAVIAAAATRSERRCSHDGWNARAPAECDVAGPVSSAAAGDGCRTDLIRTGLSGL